MNTFPLVRNKWTNEHVMAALFIVLILYMLPGWTAKPAEIMDFSIILVFSCVLDAILNTIRYKKLTCSVSAAVSAGILYILTPDTALWLRLLGVAVALLLGKHAWGGTGKNIFNPAIMGVLAIAILNGVKAPDFSPQLLLLPASILSILFIRFRPYAAVGFMCGMAAALLLKQDFSFDSYIACGVFFWGCLILTDPVTVTRNPVVGVVAGILAGSLSLLVTGSTIALAVGVLLVNLVSYVADRYVTAKIADANPIKKIIPFNNDVLYFDLSLSNSQSYTISDISDLNSEEILKRIEDNGVFGQGGAAFPSGKKLRALINSESPEKHLIINGIECDPGLIHDHWLMKRSLDDIILGIKALSKCVDFKTVTLAVKETSDIVNNSLHIKKVSDFYPVGAEKILIKQVLDRTLNHNAIPSTEGILVLNVQTVYSVYEAVYKDKKISDRLLTVADLKAKMNYVVRAKLGDSIEEILEKLPVSKGNIFVGGGAMQCRNTSDGDILDQNINFIAVGQYPVYKESPQCSKCGFCIDSCPSGLRVDKIAGLVDQNKLKEAKSYQPEQCIQCGSCSRVCLAGKNLAIRVRTAKFEQVSERV